MRRGCRARRSQYAHHPRPPPTVGCLGVGVPDLEAILDGEASNRIRCMLTDAEHRPWQNFYRYQLWRHYGHIATPDKMMQSNYSFHKIVSAPQGTISETCRRAFRAWGKLPTVVCEPPRSKDEKAHETIDPELARSTLILHHNHPNTAPPPT